ncbi:hypothetical protein HHL23_03120 [Chryseobacterium sp. RP-3-3]|uniref:Uncharacterized protein n=1 Tax=Chryseobacterium antibioticum TaxID=2728847 RepID=A0A7Y0FQ98_9FLAO|nr:hypothetical protein [Chryseobacterium antibioticum]NML68788.1 hypothetical protein [Chryseobacterium antibioticum]
MIQFILMLLSLAFSNNNANTAACNNNQGQPTVQLAGDPGEGLDPGDGNGNGNGHGNGGNTGGNTGQTPPFSTQP